MAECTEGMSNAELGSAIVPLFPLGVRMLGCSTMPSACPDAGCFGMQTSFLLACFFSFFLFSFFSFFLDNSVCCGHRMSLGHTTDLVLFQGRRVELRSLQEFACMQHKSQLTFLDISRDKGNFIFAISF